MAATNPADMRWAQVYGSPGEQPRWRGFVRVLLPLLSVVAVAAYVLGAALRWPPLPPAAAGAVLLGLAVALAVLVRASRAQLDAFVKGARGEERVARLLALLPQTYAVFHGLKIGDNAGDVDHVVVGPGGLFVIETKNWTGRVTVADGRILLDGREPDRAPLEQVRRAADHFRSVLREVGGPELPVQPVLCFVENATAPAPTGVGGVLVCASGVLCATIQEQTEGHLPPATQARIVTALRTHLSP